MVRGEFDLGDGLWKPSADRSRWSRFYSPQSAMLDCGQQMARNFKILVGQRSDGFVAYPLGMRGVVVGEGESYAEALADVESAIRFHMEAFCGEVLGDGSPVIEAFIAETTLSA